MPKILHNTTCGMLFFVCFMNSSSLYAQEAVNVFQRAGGSVYLIEARNQKASVQGSAVAFGMSFDESTSKPNGTYLATNFHVVEAAHLITLKKGSRSYNARVMFGDKDLDFAILLVSGEFFPITETANSDSIRIGDRVYAIGSPLGLENSISEGIVSGKRLLNDIPVIQTTAPISKGNSGGGLFDKNAKLIGITTFKLIGGENLNFALDISFIKEVDRARLAAWHLRAVFDRRLSEEQKKLLNNDRFVGWLMKFGPRNVRIYEEVLTSGDAVTKGLLRLEDRYSVIEGIVNTFLSLDGQESNRAEVTRNEVGMGALTLSCRSPPNIPREPIILTIDFDAKLVNQLPALMDVNSIFWESPDKHTRYLLDRKSGAWNGSNDGGRWLRLGDCAPIAERRF